MDFARQFRRMHMWDEDLGQYFLAKGCTQVLVFDIQILWKFEEFFYMTIVAEVENHQSFHPYHSHPSFSLVSMQYLAYSLLDSINTLHFYKHIHYNILSILHTHLNTLYLPFKIHSYIHTQHIGVHHNFKNTLRSNAPESSIIWYAFWCS